jgi:hypothetical protein
MSKTAGKKHEVEKNQVHPWIMLHMKVQDSLFSDQPVSFRKGFEVKAPVSSSSNSPNLCAKGEKCALQLDTVH